MYQHFAIAAALTIVCAASSPALATISSAAAVRDFSYTLDDLNSLDGIAPALTWQSRGGSSVGATVFSENSAPVSKSDASFQLFSPVSTDARIGWASSQASVSGAQATHTLTYQASGQIETAQGLEAIYDSFAELSFFSFQPTTFTLSPHTKANFTALADLVGTVDPAPGSSADEQFATAIVDFLIVVQPRGTLQSSYTLTVSNGSQSLTSRQVGLEIANPSEMPLTAYIELDVEARGSRNFLPQVPEPGTAAMALAGLLVVGAASRRSGWLRF